MRLFDMTDYQIDRAVQAHNDRLYDDFFHINDPEPCCSNCCHYCSDGTCFKLEHALTPDDIEQMEETHDYSAIEVDNDYYCDDWYPKEN